MSSMLDYHTPHLSLPARGHGEGGGQHWQWLTSSELLGLEGQVIVHHCISVWEMASPIHHGQTLHLLSNTVTERQLGLLASSSLPPLRYFALKVRYSFITAISLKHW